MTDATAVVSPLRRRMIDDMSLRNLSPATQRSYIHAVMRFSRFHRRSPDQLGLEDVRSFQVYLVSQGVSWGALNQTVCALRFFYGVTLDRAEIPERIAYARTPRKLPDILSADEVVRFLEAVPSLKARAALTTAYAAGLRASETVSLKIADMDSDRMLIQVHHGKGGKDRTVMLSPQLLGILRTYWRLVRPEVWLFPERSDKPIDVQVLHAACRSATKAAGLVKRVASAGLRALGKAHLPTSAQMRHELLLEHPARLDEEAAIDRFVRYLHAWVAWVLPLQPTRYLCRRPLLRQLVRAACGLAWRMHRRARSTMATADFPEKISSVQVPSS